MEARTQCPDPDALRRASQEARRAYTLDAEQGDPGGAAEVLEAAVAALGPLPILTVPLADLLARLERWKPLGVLCRTAASACTDPREAATWHLRVAEASEAVGEIDAAVAARRAALAARPRDLDALHALQRLHRAEENHAALARALEEELALRVGDDEIAPRIELAALLAGPLARGSEALVHLRRVLDLDPGDTECLTRALALTETLGASGEQVSLLERALARSGSRSERAWLLARQAALLAGPLNSPAEAIPRWREALALDPATPGAHPGLRGALERLEDWPALLECLHQEARHAGADARRSLFEHAARIASERFGHDATLPWLDRLRAEAPFDPTILARISDVHREAGRSLALLESLDAEIALAPPPERALQLAREQSSLRAAVYGAGDRRQIHAAPDARSLQPPPEMLLARRPGSATPRCAEMREGDPVAAEETERELAALDPAAEVYAERRLTLQRQLAQVYADDRHDAERALPHLRALVDSAAVRPDERLWAEERLLVCLRAEGSQLELAQRLDARLLRDPDDPAGWLELAQLQERALHAPGRAVVAYQQALERGADPLEVLAGLRRASTTLGDWPEVARTLEAELIHETSPRRRAELLRTLGDVAWRRLGATTRASRAFAAALEADPRDRVSLRALQQLLASMEDWRGALDLIESEAELLPEGESEERRSLWLRAAGVAADRLGDAERAVRALEAAESIAPLSSAERRTLATLLHRSGERERYVDVAMALGDEAGAATDVAEELRLAATLHALGRLDQARGRAKRALVAAPDAPGAWELLAEILLAEGAIDAAAESLARAAERAEPASAVALLLRAATLVEPGDPEYAHGLCEAACARDVASVSALAARARSALALGRSEEAEAAATRAADLAASCSGPAERAAVVEVALAVAAAARSRGQLVRAARIHEGVHAVAPDHPEALRARAEVLFALGDRRGARRAVSCLLARDPGGPKDASLLLIEAEGLEEEAALEEAAERFAEATRNDPRLERAWAGLARAHERAGRPLEAVRALDAWADVALPPVRRACQLRAAELLLVHDGDGSAERRLRVLLEGSPACVRAAELLASLLLARARPADALAVASLTLDADGGPTERRTLLRLRARALEDLGQNEEACVAHSRVLEADPDAVDAARARAALLRASGSWHAAARSLESFLEHMRAVDSAAQARVWLELSQLRAGPLQDAAGARHACAEAVRLHPASHDARAALADLLVRDPTAHVEAVERHRELLESTPDRVESLRALLALAEAAGQSECVADGQMLMHVMGHPAEGPEIPTRLLLRVALAPTLENPVWERARQLALAAAPEIARALEASEVLEPMPAAGPIESFRLAAIVAEAELAGPALVPLRDEQTGAVLSTVALLASEREIVSGDGRLVNALSTELGRSSRRRVREALAGSAPEEISEIDFVAWRAALRSLAHAVALDATGGDLRAALDALAGERGEAEGSHAARELLRRVVVAFGRAITGEEAAR